MLYLNDGEAIFLVSILGVVVDNEQLFFCLFFSYLSDEIWMVVGIQTAVSGALFGRRICGPKTKLCTFC